MAKRVFVSSTFSDLKDHREAVRGAIRRLGAIDVAMEHFGSREERPKDECLRIVREESDVFVGIYAHRYGFVPAADTVSISESEFEAAGTAGVPRMVYLVDETVTWPPKDVEGEPGLSRLKQFKARLRADHIVSTFSDTQNLAAIVAADLGRTFSERDLTTRGYGGLYHQPADGWTSPIATNQWRYKVAAFDLDGTLLRGAQFQFSWEAVWKELGFSLGVQQELRSEYRKRTKDGADDRVEAYRDWCQKACAHFTARKLSRAKLRSIVEPLQVTRNFEAALTKLRSEGVVTALISGGIHTFLEDKIPDFRNWFDFVFVNVLKFDDAGVLSGVVATEFDFEGKEEALRLVAERTGCTMDETVFVGDAFNDEAILLAAGKGIAYATADKLVEGAARVRIGVDDLEEVVKHVLVP